MNNNLPKLLAVLVNYGNEQISFLEKVVKELKSFEKFDVTVIVNSNIDLNIEEIDKVNTLTLPDYQLLPLTCRSVIWENRNDYDVFIYGENDHLFLERHIEKHIEYSNILPKNKISGLIQFEENETGKYYPAFHAKYNWDLKSVKEYGGKKFAHFTNVHQASFILTKEQMLRAGANFDFLKLVNENTLLNKIKRELCKFGFKIERQDNKYSVKCKVNTDVYLYGGMKKMICISEFNDNLIHHLPNLYIDGKAGRLKLRADENKMDDSIKRLLNHKS